MNTVAKWLESLPLWIQAVALLIVVLLVVAMQLWQWISTARDVMKEAKEPWGGNPDDEARR